MDAVAETNGGERKRVPEHESKREKFERLIDQRVQKALVAIRQVARLGGANSKNYDYGREDIARILAALRDEVDEAEKQLLIVQPKQVPLFSIRAS